MSNWTGLGIGTKNSEGDWIEMFFAEENISSDDLESVSYTHLTLPTKA